MQRGLNKNQRKTGEDVLCKSKEGRKCMGRGCEDADQTRNWWYALTFQLVKFVDKSHLVVAVVTLHVPGGSNWMAK